MTLLDTQPVNTGAAKSTANIVKAATWFAEASDKHDDTGSSGWHETATFDNLVADDTFTRAPVDPAEGHRRAISQITHSPVMPDGFRVSGLEKWTGRILEIDEGGFSAEIVPGEGGASLIAEFNRDQIADADIEVGDLIYITVRTVDRPRGQRNQTSSIRLARLGKWTENEIWDQAGRADAMSKALKDLIE